MADLSYRTIPGGLLQKGIPFIGELPKDKELAREKLYKGIKRSADTWSHPQVAVEKLPLKRLGFEPTRLAVPLPGEKPGTISWRSGDLHAHKQGPVFLVHRDKTDPSSISGAVSHGLVDLPVAVVKRLLTWDPSAKSRKMTKKAVSLRALDAAVNSAATDKTRLRQFAARMGRRARELQKVEGLSSPAAAKRRVAEVAARSRSTPRLLRPELQAESAWMRGKPIREVRKAKSILAKYGATRGYYKGESSSPDSVKFKTEFQGIPVQIERPRGFVMMGVGEGGKPWSRRYRYDYGHIPRTLGGDNEGLDVFIGPNKKAEHAYWAVQRKPDGSFDEYKVFLGFDNRDEAASVYRKHIPKKLLAGLMTLRIDMMKAMLGKNPEQELKVAMWKRAAVELSKLLLKQVEESDE